MAEQSVVQLFPQEPTDEVEADTKSHGALPEEHLRVLEAILFASAEPVGERDLAARLPEGAEVSVLLRELAGRYASRGVTLVQVAKGWAFRTASDLAHLMTREVVEQRRMSRAALEMLAIIAYHQPVTRAEIEDIRGVGTSRGTLDLLMELGWVRITGRRQVPGRPVLFGTTSAFLEHFSLDRISDLPGVDELSAAGLLDKKSPRVDVGLEDPAADSEAEEDDFGGGSDYMDADPGADSAPL